MFWIQLSVTKVFVVNGGLGHLILCVIGTQSKLQEQQLDMRKTLDTSMADLQKSYERLGEDMGFLQTLTSETQKQISEVAGTVSSHLDNLQSKADDIGNIVTLSLGQQK